MVNRLYTFRPNTITYGIPTDHPIGQAAGRAKIGVVFHTHYQVMTFNPCRHWQVQQ